jgi:hypothetical protein
MAMAAALVAVGGVAAAAPLDWAQQPAPRAAGCGGLKPTLKGSNGPDKLKGTASDDVIAAGRGADVVKAGAGDDTLCGGPGKDKLLGGPGVDTCVGGPGKDKLKGCEPAGGPPGGAAPPTVNQSPVADDESFGGDNGAVGNTALVVNAPGDSSPALSTPKKSISGDILAGDTDPDGDPLVVQTVTNQPTNDGGRVTIESDGNFIFTPVASTSCTDHSDFFDYTVSDQNAVGPGPTPGTDTGRVTIAIAGCVWYVNNSAAGNGGTSDAPFDTLAQAEAASGANDTVFVFDGDNTSTGYGGDGYAMNAGERLIGEHEGLVVDPDGGGPLGSVSLQPANPGARPTLTATNVDVIDLGDGTVVRGVNLNPTGSGDGIAGGADDSGTISNNNITVANGAPSEAISISQPGAGAVRVAITNNTISYAGAQFAILVQAGQSGNGSLDATITGNTIDIQLDGTGDALEGILAQNAITGPGVTSSLCADIGGAGALSNTFTHSLGGTMAGGDMRVRQRNDGTVRLPGYGGGPTDTAAVTAYLNGRNTEVSPSTATFETSGFAGGAACTQPAP